MNKFLLRARITYYVTNLKKAITGFKTGFLIGIFVDVLFLVRRVYLPYLNNDRMRKHRLHYTTHNLPLAVRFGYTCLCKKSVLGITRFFFRRLDCVLYIAWLGCV